VSLTFRLAVSFVVAASVVGVTYVSGGAGAHDSRTLGPGLVTVEVDIDDSRFSIGELSVEAGTTVRFLVRNNDPINHELVVGPPGVHESHSEGTETRHPPVPGEVSVGPGETGVTYYEFEEPSTLMFACHLPRHFEYGMRGFVIVD
jgi:uncharacterized cupredoxin-like copper-binding protein